MTPRTSTTLTDRYVWTVTRHLTADVGPDVARELRATIADAVDARVEAGADPTELRWASIGTRPRVALDEPLVARGHTVTEMTPDEARRHLGP